MSEQKKTDQQLIKLNTQNMRPALRSSERTNLSSVDSTNNIRPLELNHPIVVPMPPIQTYSKPIFLNEPTRDIPTGCFAFMSWMVLELELVGLNNSLRVTPHQGEPLIIGRNPESAPSKIDIDLTAFADGGISRVHAAIKLEGTRLELADLNSTNGTSINGIRFNPNESHPIRSGDLIMLAQFQIIAKFTPRLESSNRHDTSILSPIR